MNINSCKSASIVLLTLSTFILSDIHCQTYRIDTLDGQTIETCSGTFYDSGAGAGDYSNGENYTVTFYTSTGERITFDYTSFDLRNEGGDTLKIYDGPDDTYPLLGAYTGEGLSFTVQSTDTCLTFEFTSDGSLTNSGWEATISCCPVPAISPITGSNAECINSAGIAYSVVNTPGSTYDWIITKGTQSGGGNSNSIIVDWGSVSGSAKVQVVEDNGCTLGDTVSLDVILYSLPSVSFSGLDSVYDINLDGPATLTGIPSGGSFSGNGISGDQFDPAAAGLGIHEIVYSYTDINGCTNTDTNYTSVRDYDNYSGARLLTDFDGWCSANAAYTTSGATADGNAASCWNTNADYTRWFKFQATTNMINVTVKTGGSYGTVRRINAAVWEADGTTEVACNRYVSNWDSVVVGAINLTPGNWYFISIDNNYGPYRGSFTLCIDDEADYDFYEGAIELTDISDWSSPDAIYTTLGATQDKNAGSCWNTSPNYNRWFKFQATTSAINVEVRRGGSYGTIRRINAALWENDGLTEIECNRYVGNDDNVIVGAVGLTPGNWYYVSVDNNYSGYRGTFSLYVDNQVDYDFYEGAIEITNTDNWCSSDAEYTTLGATPDKNAASCWNTSPNYNRWFRFTAATNLINIEVQRGGTKGTIRRINVAIFEADGTTEVSCNRYVNNDDNVIVASTNLIPGNVYYISVDNNYSGYRGTFTLCVDDDLDYDYFEGAKDVTGYINSCSADAEFTTLGATPDKTAPSCWNTNPDYNRWFKFIATTPAIKVQVKRGGSFGTIRRINLALYDTDGTTVLACNRYVNNDDNVEVSYEGLTVSQWYYIAVDNNYSGYRGTFTLCLDDKPSYDYYEGAIELGIIHDWTSADAAYTTLGATSDKNAASCWNTSPDYNRWFKFTATTPQISFEVRRGGSYGTIRRINTAIWESDGTTEVACKQYVSNDDNVVVEATNLTPGNEYYASVDNNYSGYRGTFSLYVNDEVGYDYYEGAVDVTEYINSMSPLEAYTTVGATSDKNAASCWNTGPNYNRWFKFQATSPGISVTVKRGGSYGTIRRVNAAIWDADGTTELACNRYVGDDDEVEVSHEGLTIGNWYYISVDNNYSGYRGTFTLELNDAVSYDYYEGAIELTDIHNWTSADAAYTTLGATSDKNAATCWNTSPNYNRWFKFTATTSFVNVEVRRGGSLGTVRRINVALWEDDGTTEVACNRYVGNDDNVALNTNTLTPGNEYYISVDNNYSGYRGTFTLHVNDALDYDFYEGAIELTDLNNWTSPDAAYTTLGATSDKNAASCWNTSPNYNRWFKFVAISPDVAIQVLRGGSYGTIRRINVALWEADGTTEVACNRYVGNDDNVSINHSGLTVGNQYYISVDNNYSGYRGTFTLQVNNISSVEYYAIANGNWNDPNTWSNSDGGPPAGSVPDAGNIVHIKGYTVTVIGTDCGALYLEVLNDHTSLIIDADTLNVHGSLTMINNGSDYDGIIIVRNSGGLNIDDDFILNRAGGANEFSVTVNDNSFISVAKDLNIISSAGTVFENQFTLNGTSTVQIDQDINLDNSGGQKINIQLNTSAELTVLRDISISATAQNQVELELNNTTTLNIGRNFVRGSPAYGILDCNNNSTLAFQSADYTQVFPQNSGSGTDDFTYQNITINNSRIATPQLSLEGPVTIPGTLTLTDGIIETTAANLLTLENTASLAGGSAASYITGPIEKIGNAGFTFPVGKDGNYKPVSISAPSNATDAFIAEYFNENPDGSYDISLKEATIDHVANCEYWIVDRSNGSSGVDVTIGWDGISCCINDLVLLKVVAWDGSQWTNLGNGGTTGNLLSGTITSSSSITNNNNPITFGDPFPIVDFSGLAGPYCLSDAPVALTGSPQDANGTFSGDGVTDNGNGTGSFDPSVAGKGTHNITYTYVNGVSGCSNEITKSDTVNGLPTATTLDSDTVCPGVPVDISIYFTGLAPWDVTYTNNTDTTNLITSDNPYEFIAVDSGTYHVIALFDANGCTGNDFGDSAVIKYYQQVPVPTIDTVGNTTFCDDDTLLLIASGGGLFSLWSNGETTDTINVSVSDDYYVQTVDSNLCVSENSDTTTVLVYHIPRKPFAINGTDTVCQNSADTDYTTFSQYASSYIWELFPVSAGIISGTGTTGTVDWDAAFNGTAKIVAKGENLTCGIGEASDTLNVAVTAFPGQAGTPSGDDTLLVDSPDTDYTTSGATGATSYNWSISPVAAGSISGTGTTGTVDWDNAWTGTAYITVRGMNACGSGIWSDTLTVEILGNPSVSFSGPALSGLESISPVQFIVNLSFPIPFDVSFDYTTTDGTAINGVGNDYATAAGNLTISAGNIVDTLLVTVYEDATEESNENFTLTLYNFINSEAGSDTVITYTILDNDGLGWVGPGGVGNLSDQINVWHSTYYSDNLSDGESVSTNPDQWDDLSVNNVDAYQDNASYQPTFYDISPVWNGRPIIRFNSALNEYLKINDNQWMNTAPGAQTKRTIIVAFRPGTDISSRQVVFEEGATIRGLNIYIEDDTLYIGGWNDNNDDGGQTTPWLYTSVKSEISANTPYFAIMQFDFDDILMTGEIRGSLNGVDLGALPGAGKLFPHSGDIGVGAMNGGACWEGGSCSGGTGNYFDGYIAEFVSGDIVYNQAALKIVHNYFAAKYGISLPGGEDIYDYESTHSYELIGIGQVDASNYHNFSQGQGIIRIQNPSNIGDNKFLLAGHDDGDISNWTNTEVPDNDTNIVRVSREWRVDKQGGDIGSIDMIIDSSEFGSYYSSYSKFVLIIDNDGDFTSGSRTVELEDAGPGLYQATGVDFTKGEYFTIARIRPAIEFQLTESDGDEDAGTVDITIRMNYASNSDVTVDYYSTDGTADKDQLPVGDYDELTGTFTLPAGDTSGAITLTINNDAVVESDETLTITLNNPSSGINLGDNTVHTFTIHDDDNSRKVQFTSQSGSGDESITPVLIDLHLTENNPTNPVDVDYNILAGSTAENGGIDFNLAASGTVTFGINDTLESLSVTINDDAISENTETIIIEITNPVNANLGDTTIYTYNITDNDPEPEVYFSTISASGAESYSPVQVIINLTTSSGKDIQVNHTVTGGTAQPGGIDFTFADGTATIPSGEDSIILLLDIFNDMVEESNEDLEITLSNPANAILGDDSVFTYMIIDDDGLGWLGPGGVGNFDNQIACWLRSTTAPGLSDGEKVSTDPNNWKDQTGKGNHAFQTSASNQPTFWDISPTWNGRPLIEFDRGSSTFLDIADNPDMNTPSGAQTKRTIIVAFRPASNISNRQVVFEEGGGIRGLNIYIEQDSLFIGGWNENNDDGGLTTPWPYTYVSSEINTNTPYFAILQFDFDDLLGTGEVRGSLNGIDLGQLPGAGKLFPHSGDIGIGGQSNGACYKGGSCQGGDNNFFDGYIAELISGNIVFNSAQLKIVHNYLTAKYNITLPGGDDIYDYENNHGYELFGIGQENAANSHYIAQGSGIIRIENPSSAGDGRYLMIGHDGAGIDDWKEYDEEDVPNNDPNIQRVERVWRVDKQGGDIGTVSVRLDTTSIPVKSFGYSKYVLITDSDGDFTSGARTIGLTPDGQEYHSAANINFTKGDYFTIGIIKPTVEFLDTVSNDQEPVTSIDPLLPEFVVRLNYEASSDITVDYTTSDGSALAGFDYTAESSSVTIPAGDTSATFNISIINDTDIEPDENFLITLSNPPSGVQIGSNSVHTFTINDEDNPRKVEFTLATGSGDEGTTPVTVEVSINLMDAFNYTKFDYTVTGGTATEGAGNDFILANGTDSIAPGSTTVNLPAISINDDAFDEDDETFIITLSNPVNANLGTNTTYTYTIQDNDSEPTVEFENSTSNGAESYNPACIIVRLSAVSGQDVTVDYTAADITATGGGIDYTLAPGILTIPAGIDSSIIYVDIFNDMFEESTESFSITLSNPSNATLGINQTIQYFIYDDDGLGYIGPGGVGNETQYLAWLDANRESYANGANVTVFNDQSGNSNEATAAAGNAPTFSQGAINSRHALTFNGSNDYMNIANTSDINTASAAQTLRTLVMAFRTGTSVAGRQVLYEEGGGTRGLNIYIDNGNLYLGGWNLAETVWGFTDVNQAIATNSVYYVMLEMNQPAGIFKGYLNGNLIGDSIDVGLLYSHSGDISIGRNGGSRFHNGTSSTPWNFNGEIMEFLTYNYVLNEAQKKIVENYFASKYRNEIETGMANDMYDYRISHGYELFGIGQEDGSNTHIIAQGTGIIRIDNPTNLDDGDYILIGHDNNGIANWITDSIPYDSIQRIRRNWIVDEVGDISSIRLGVDTSVLPAKPAFYESYVILVDANSDADFDMSTNPQDVSMNPMTVKSGALRLVNNIGFSAGDVFTIGIARNRTIRNGNWNDNSTWLLNIVPGPGETALITAGDTIDLASDVTIGNVVIGNTSVLNLNSYEFTLTNNTFQNNGTLNIGTSTFNYGGSIDQDVLPLAYHNFKISGSGTKTLTGNISVANDLTILGVPGSLTLDVDAVFNYTIDITGNWQNTATFNPQNGRVNFVGTNQSITRTAGAEDFSDLNIQTSGSLTLASDVNVSNEIIMDGGNIFTGTHKLTVGTGAGNPGILTRNSGYIIGNLERWIVNNNPYEFPIGTATYYRAVTIQFSNVTLGGSLQIGFDGSNPGNSGLPLFESGLYVVNTFTEGFWTVDEINSITYTGGFDVDLTANGFTSYSIAAGTRVVTRPNDLSDWVLSGTHVDAAGIIIQRDAITVLPCELAIADTSLCDVNANVSSNDVTCNGASDGTITISSPTGGSGVYEYTINGGTGWQASGNFTGLGPNTYDVRIRDANNINCETTLDGSLVIIEPPPVVPTITGNDTLCEGTTEIYTTEAGMTNYDWEVSAGGTVLAGGDGNDSITIRWDDIEAQTVSVNYEDGGCAPASPTVLDIWIHKLPDTGPGYHIENEFDP